MEVRALPPEPHLRGVWSKSAGQIQWRGYNVTSLVSMATPYDPKTARSLGWFETYATSSAPNSPSGPNP